MAWRTIGILEGFPPDPVPFDSSDNRAVFDDVGRKSPDVTFWESMGDAESGSFPDADNQLLWKID